MFLQVNQQLPIPDVGRRTVRTPERSLSGVGRHFVPLAVGEVREGPLAESTRVRFDPGVHPQVRLQLLLGG